MLENTFKVMDKESKKVYDAVAQAIRKTDGSYVLAWNIGINGYNEWSFLCMVYSNENFNNKYEVVKWSKNKKQYIPEGEYKFWIDDKED